MGPDYYRIALSLRNNYRKMSSMRLQSLIKIGYLTLSRKMT